MDTKSFKILVLDGGGSKGVYTLGFLKELELLLGSPLYNHFDLIYGTSTGSIISALIGLGTRINEIEKLYFKLIPDIMGAPNSKMKSAALKKEAEKIFGATTFKDFKTDIGIVAMNFDAQRPLIFKTDVKLAYGMKHSFVPGFGCTIAQAVQCSCAAYPIFDVVEVELQNVDSKSKIKAIDGGFIANNASLFALIDAHKAVGKAEDKIRLLNVGVGSYIEQSMGWKHDLLNYFDKENFLEKVLSANTNTNVQTARLLFPAVQQLRVSDSFPEPKYGTNMIEADPVKLQTMQGLGRASFAKYEHEIKKLLF